MNNQATSRQGERPLLTGMFRDRESTEGAYKSLRDRGYSDDEINVLMSDETRDKYYSDGDSALEGNKALEGTGAGAAIGGTLGAIIGGIALFVIGLIIRAALSSETPPGWLSFISRRRAEGKSTKWREWKDED